MPPKDPKNKAAKGAPPKPPAAAKAPTYKEVYESYLPKIALLADAEVEPCRADVRVAFANAKLGIKAVLGDAAQIAQVRAHLPKIPLDDVLELPDLGRALVFAAGKVVSRAASAGQIDEKIKAINKPREDMLKQAEILVGRGKLDRDLVAKIRSGSGKYDMARDGVDLVELYTEHRESIRGQHPFTDDEIATLQANSEWLVEHLTPDGARSEARKKSPAEDVRDRLWTLMLRRHPHLRKIGHYLHGDDVDLHVPRLQSRVAQAVLEEETGTDTPPEGALPGAAPQKP